MENLNIAELLRDCPKGMKLYSPIFGDVYLDKIRPHLAIIVTTDKEQGDFKEEFLYDGRYRMNGECMLFPSKGKTTWEGFQKPFFKDGDIVATTTGSWIGITVGGEKNRFIPTYCVIKINGEFEAYFDKKETWEFHRLATEEEKLKLFDAIKANGYKWNAETKTLEKLIEPKFKVGDKIEKCGYRFTIKEVREYHYLTKCGNLIAIANQDDLSLVPNKFDIATLKAFESRVLVRDYNNRIWIPTFWGKRLEDDSNCSYLTTNGCYKYCIPYEDNHHLLGTSDDCCDFYKTWEK